uniref:CYP89A2 n=1 Tax=Gynostemma pentaphyllum TaxID=182084 RepID=A0A8F2F5Y6_GYNPE|nr:CYP89A2 [Gynostemma pentaphyllum]
MEIWFLILISISICALLKPIIFPSKLTKLPPGPPSFHIIGILLWLRKTPLEIESTLRNLHSKYGPIITVYIGPFPSIFIADRSLAHKALIQNGIVFADRPPVLSTIKIISSNQFNISTAFYGSTWRLLRRNLTSEILNPSRVRSYMRARKWVLDILFDRLLSHSKSSNSIRVVDHFQFSMFCLLVLMCFGDKLDENQIKEIEAVQRKLLVSYGRFNVLNFWPRLTKIFLPSRWEEFFNIKNSRDKVLFPLIEARKKVKQERFGEIKDEGDEFVLSYVDTLLDLEHPLEKRKLDNGEIVSICSEFLNAGTDTTSTALQWIMANLVKYPNVQEKLFEEIKEVVGNGTEEVNEEDLGKLPYLKAVVLEGLRRHPPGHFVLPHAVKEDVIFEGYIIPKKGTVNFLVADMNLDPKVWEDPMEFKPERFMENGKEMFDITGSKEIKMMPFGAGRRICPGFGLAILHLEYFVANLVWRFEWKAVDGDEVDLSEKVEFTTVMKNPLLAHLRSRF